MGYKLNEVCIEKLEELDALAPSVIGIRYADSLNEFQTSTDPSLRAQYEHHLKNVETDATLSVEKLASHRLHLLKLLCIEKTAKVAEANAV